MKLRIVIDTEISKSMAETIQRSGFTLCQDGSGMQIKVSNAPPIPRRKVKVEYIPEDKIASTTQKGIANAGSKHEKAG